MASHGPTRGQLGPTWGQLGANLGPVWANIGQLWATLGPTWVDLGRLGPAQASSGPIWAPVRAMFGSTWAHFGLNLAQLEFQVAPTAVQQTAESKVQNHWSKGLFETAPGQTHQRTCPTNCRSRAATVDRSKVKMIMLIITSAQSGVISRSASARKYSSKSLVKKSFGTAPGQNHQRTVERRRSRGQS